MNNGNINEKNEFENLYKELFQYIKFITDETKIDYDYFVDKLKKSKMFQEFEEILF